MRRIALFGATAAVTAAALLAAPRPAAACGGFFCSQTPVDQTGEKIVFTHDQDQNLVTYVQVQYQGAAEQFSWVLPVPGEPTVEVGTDAIFQALDQATAPYFYLNWHEEGTCSYDGRYGPASDDSDGALGGGSPTAGNEGGGGVTVVSQGAIGPYDRVTLAASDPDALLRWLADNDYDVTPEGQELLRLYVDNEHFFVALKLQSDRGVGDLVPIVLRYREPLPCVPLRLTAVAAQDNMGITAYVLSDRRAVPLNYYHVKLNEARIDWFSYGQNYRELLTEAVDAAPNGQAFLTEFAGPSQLMRGQLWTPGRYDLEALRGESDPVNYVQTMLGQGFRGSAQLLAFFQRFIPMPQALRDQGVTEQDFYNCLECYEGTHQIPFDPVAATADLESTVVEPLRAAQELLDSQPYLTRLGTTMSADEMTLDPYFTYNLDLGDVSNAHVADAYVECGVGRSWSDAPVRIVTADGSVMRYPAGVGGWYAGGGEQPGGPTAADAGPAAAIVEKIGELGPGEIIEDNRPEIAEALARPDRTIEPDGSCGGCGTGGGASRAGSLGALACLALLQRPEPW